MNRIDLLKQLKSYKGFDGHEERMRTNLIDFILSNEKCYFRELLTGHITASCWVINQDASKVLLLHHAKLDKWLQPGGHCDGNENVVEVAVKELREETGLETFTCDLQLFDLDIHTIPARGEIPEHLHYDIRFIFLAHDHQPLVQNHETKGLKWVPLADINTLTEEAGIIRMYTKTILGKYAL